MSKSLDQILGGAGQPESPMASAKGKMSEEEIAAKLEVVQQLMQEMLASMGDGVKGHLDGLAKPEMQQVTVAAPDEEGLEEGLEVAKEVLPEVAEAEAAPMEEEEPDDLFSMMQRKKKMGKA